MTKETSTFSLETGMLSYARSLQVSEGLFNGLSGFDSDHAKLVPIAVQEKGVRGQSSEDGAKNPGQSNPQSVETAHVPQGCDGVELSFTVRVLPNAMKPHAVGDTAVGRAYREIANAYASASGFVTLSELYLWNIANARFAWRNRFQSDRQRVTLEANGRKLVFDPMILGLGTPANRDELAAALTTGSRSDVDGIVTAFAAALDASSSALVLSVRWSAAMSAGEEIFPSQEYLREEKQKKDLSRVYAKLPTTHNGRVINQASLHSQKIGSALRHIDIWHGDDRFTAIAVNPYGGVQETSDVLRGPKSKSSFYDIRKKANALLSSIEDSDGHVPAEAHFFMANLIRGGVFGAKNTSKARKTEDAA